MIEVSFGFSKLIFYSPPIVRIRYDLCWYLSSLTLHTAVVSSVQSLLVQVSTTRQPYTRTCSKNIYFVGGRSTLSTAMKLRDSVFET